MFPALRFMSNTAMNTGVQVSGQTYVFISVGWTSTREMAGSYGNSVFKFL